MHLNTSTQVQVIKERALFDGKTFDKRLDQDRLSKQMRAVIELMSDGKPRSLESIAFNCDIPQQSASARLRDLRKDRYGNQEIKRTRISAGQNYYQWIDVPDIRWVA